MERRRQQQNLEVRLFNTVHASSMYFLLLSLTWVANFSLSQCGSSMLFSFFLYALFFSRFRQETAPSSVVTHSAPRSGAGRCAKDLEQVKTMTSGVF